MQSKLFLLGLYLKEKELELRSIHQSENCTMSDKGSYKVKHVLKYTEFKQVLKYTESYCRPFLLI